MLILSKDKRTIINLDNITQIYCIEYDKSNVDIACCFNRGGEILGRYSSIERCKEIMQDILTKYEHIKDKAEKTAYYTERDGKTIKNKKYVYYMPEE